MSSRRDAAQVLALTSWVRRELKKIEERAKDAAEVEFVGEKIAATVTVDGMERVVSPTTHVQNQPEFKVTDDAAFVQWVAKRYPSEIVYSVRKSFIDNVLRPSAIEMGALIDNDGEVCDAVQIVDGPDYLRTYLTKAADDMLRPLLAGRSLNDLVRAIEYLDEPVDLDQEAS